MPSSTTRICSLHFRPSDYLVERQDSNLVRKNKEPITLNKKMLKKSAVPSVFPNLPEYLTKPEVKERSINSTISGRRQKEEQHLQQREDAFFANDQVCT